jgi:arsenate reductase (glutaredoxin)
MEERLSANELKQLLRCAGLSPQDAVRTNEGACRQHVAGKNLSDDELLQIMAEYPELLQRPIVVRENKAVLARPVEKLAELQIK